jgi:hypothetical protein
MRNGLHLFDSGDDGNDSDLIISETSKNSDPIADEISSFHKHET